MAKADPNVDLEPGAAAGDAAPARRSKGRVIVITLIALVVIIAAVGGIAWFATSSGSNAKGGGAEAHAEPKAEALYLPLEPAFVVNLEGGNVQRYLQVEIQLMTRDPKVSEAVDHHMPHIRSALLLLLGQQTEADLSTRAGKEKLQQGVLDEVNHVLEDETGTGGVEAVYFTKFVTQ